MKRSRLLVVCQALQDALNQTGEERFYRAGEKEENGTQTIIFDPLEESKIKCVKLEIVEND